MQHIPLPLARAETPARPGILVTAIWLIQYCAVATAGALPAPPAVPERGWFSTSSALWCLFAACRSRPALLAFAVARSRSVSSFNLLSAISLFSLTEAVSYRSHDAAFDVEGADFVQQRLRPLPARGLQHPLLPTLWRRLPKHAASRGRRHGLPARAEPHGLSRKRYRLRCPFPPL